MDMIWFAVGIGLLVVELATFGLISIWFAMGAFVTMFFPDKSLLTQFYIFSAVSLISLFLVRKTVVKHLKKNKSKELDRISKQNVKIRSVSEKDGHRIYNVYLDGKHWTAISNDEFQVDDTAFVEKIQGNKLILKK